MDTKPAITEYVVQWFNPNEGWADLEGAETETAAHQAARRFLEQDRALGVDNRYRVLAIQAVEYSTEAEAAAACDERDGFTAEPHPASSLNDFPADAERKAALLAGQSLTPASLDLFLSLAEDAPNWSGTPLVTVSPAERGNLSDLKKKGLVETMTEEDGCVFAVFTEAGIALAVEHGHDGEYLRHV